ncbi:MAG: sensor histidine kinase [Acidimicrobiales bacterium]
MIVTVILLAIAACLGALAVASSQRRGRRLARRLDEVASQVAGDVVISSPTPELATDRLERILHRRASIPPSAQQLEADRYRIALASITLGVVLVDEDGRVRYRNPFAETFLSGRSGAAVVAQVLDDLVRSALDGVSGEREVQLYGPPRRKLLVSASPIVEGARFLGAAVLIDDITEQERLDAIRRDFVANISHELRTPIGAMSLLAETLVGETDPDVIESLSSRLGAEAARLGRTIEDLLQLSRIEHGSDDHFGPVVLQHVVSTACDRVRAAAEQQGVAIGVSAPSVDLVVRGDERQLASAIFNLLDNAVKYSGAGPGAVSVRLRRRADQVEVTVQDSGIGVPRKDLDRIFERFYRVDPSRGRDSGGTGLGLAIVRHVVANHGGRIEVESTEGEGTTFTLLLPASGDPDPIGHDPDASAGVLGDLPSSPPPPDDGNDHEVTRP